MALMICPECGKEVTDTAKNCIHCGYPIKTPKKELPVKKISIVMAIALVIVACILILFLSNRLNDTEKAGVEQVVNAITNIGEVQINSDSKIAEAEKLYDALSKKCQRHVENRDELLSARESYDKLSDNEKARVIGYDKLAVAEENYKQIANL